jgi:hypothetical protein
MYGMKINKRSNKKGTFKKMNGALSVRPNNAFWAACSARSRSGEPSRTNSFAKMRKKHPFVGWPLWHILAKNLKGTK